MQITVHIDLVYQSQNYSVQIDDHKKQKTFLLDNCYDSKTKACKAANEFIHKLKN